VSTYLDASFVVSLYGPDSNRLRAVQDLQAAQRPLLITECCELEVANAFRLRVFRKDATLKDAAHSIRNLELDLNARVLERSSLPPKAFARAHQLSAAYAEQLGIRTADLLHVAAALELNAQAFFTFDLQQRKLASAVGFNLNPL
jgi:predicted nucleic acid-binding protein